MPTLREAIQKSNQDESDNIPDYETVLPEVLAEYPGLRNVHSLDDTKVIFATPDRVAANKQYGGGGYLEYWPQDETGTQEFPHPTGGTHKVLEVYDQGLRENPELLKTAIYGDLLHGMDKDPNWYNMREEFIGNYLPSTMAFEESRGRKGGWGTGNETPYSRHDAYIRAKMVPENTPGYTGWDDRIYSPAQLGIIGRMKSYIRGDKQ